MSERPATRVLHFNDCAFVGQILVEAAHRQGISWAYLPPEAVRPPSVSRNRWLARAQYLPYVARRARALRTSDVVHVHYGTSARLIRERGMPRRPYVLHLHGTDVRDQAWTEQYGDEIRRAVSGAAHVFFTTPDLLEPAQRLRDDAEFMSAFVDVQTLTSSASWTPPEHPRVAFVSRWDVVKGGPANVALAAALRRAVPELTLVGLDWGSHAQDAARQGVDLVPHMAHDQFLRLLAGSTLAIGQTGPSIGVSEAEAMAIGLPLAALGERLPHPGDGSFPPMLQGSLDEVVEAVRQAVQAPRETADRLGGCQWAREHFDPAPWVPRLAELYARIATG